MCGRFNLTHTPGLEALLQVLGHDLRMPAARVNIAPTEPVPLVYDATLHEARWWLTPHWARQPEQKYAMFNARSEGLARSPAFRGPFRSQRGVVPMSAFIEWRGEKGSKQPWLISNEEQALAVAALWDLWRGPDGALLSCTLVTTAAAPAFQPWHSRMPVLLTEAEIPRWLDNSETIDTDDPLFRPALKYHLQLQPLDRAVGNARHKSPQAMAPVGETVTLRP